MQIIITLAFLILSGCSSYRFQQDSNPFSQYGISSISIPMFYNKSSIPNVSGVFTSEIYHTLTKFNKLKLISGADNTADAFLIGIVSSREKSIEVERVSTVRSAQVTFPDRIKTEKRNDFYVPATNNINLSLRLIVIKHPTLEEIKFFQSKLSEGALGSKIIFNEVIALSNTYSLKTLDDEGVEVLGTQNRGQKRATIKGMARNASTSFRDMILYAF